MTYFHPRDFDPSQPMLDGLSLKRKFKSYYNLRTSYAKLRKLVYDFDFIDMREAAKIVDWNNVTNESRFKFIAHPKHYKDCVKYY